MPPGEGPGPLQIRDEDPVTRLLRELRVFAAGLTDDERALFATLLAPGIAAAFPEDEVQTFGLVRWDPDAVARALRRIANRPPPP